MLRVSEDKQCFLSDFEETDWALLSAPPGAGKTFMAIYGASEILSHTYNQSYQQALLLTFSRLAKNKLQGEKSHLKEKGLVAKSVSRRISVFNHHSFWWSLVRRHHGFLDLPVPHIATRWEMDKWNEQTLEQAGENDIAQPSKKAKKIAENCSLLHAFGYETLGRFCEEANEYPAFVEFCFEQRKRWWEGGLLWYNDLPLLAHRLLERHPGVRAKVKTKYPFLVMDEFQDTTEAQWQVTELFLPEKVLIMVDPEQTIHSWRGADPQRRIECYTKAADERNKDLARDFLTENHRSTGGRVVESVENFLTGSADWEKAIDCEETYGKERCKQSWYSARKYLLGKLGDLLDDNDATIGIFLCTNDEVDDLYSYLLRKKFPVRKESSKSDVLEGMRTSLCGGIQHESDEGLSASLAGIIGTVFPVQVHFGKKTWNYQIAHRKGWRKQWKEHFAELLDTWRNGPETGLLALPKTLSRMKQAADVHPSQVMWGALNATQKIRRALLSPRANERSLRETVDAIIMQLRHGRDGNRVPISVMTIHQCKGQQYDHVVLPWLASKSFAKWYPHYFFESRNEKSARLLRVAMSRAKKQVHVFAPENLKSPWWPEN